MKPESENFTPVQSIELITYMIQQAKGNVQRNSFHFLMWGWVTLAANLGMFILYQVDYAHPYIVWVITIPAWFLSLYKGMKSRQVSPTRSHLDQISGSLWICYGVAIFTLVAFGSKINFQVNPIILLFTAIPTFVSGMILKFKFLKWGGVIFWIGGIACFFVSYEIQSLIAAVTILFGYLIPGYGLKNTKV